MLQHAAAGRHHHIDSLRVIAFGILIAYHLGMYYVSWGWHVKSDYSAPWLEPLMLTVNQWRMPLVFLVSGLALHLALAGGLRAGFLRERSRRLLLPLLFGMLLIVPPQAYVEALRNQAFSGGYAQFLLHYFSFQPWPDDAFAGSDNGLTWNHLWYLPYLMVYTLIAVLLRRWRWFWAAATALVGRVGLAGLIALPIPALMAAGNWVYPLYGGSSHDLFWDGYGHAMYFCFFLMGLLIGGQAGVWQRLCAARWWLLLMAASSWAVFMFLRPALAGPDGSDWLQLQYLSIYLNRWIWILAALAWSRRLLARPWKHLAYAREAVLPWYVLHQSITVVAGYYLGQAALGPLLEPLLLILATVLGCALAHHYLIRNSALLRYCFGLPAALSPPAAPRSSPDRSAASAAES